MWVCGVEERRSGGGWPFCNGGMMCNFITDSMVWGMNLDRGDWEIASSVGISRVEFDFRSR